MAVMGWQLFRERFSGYEDCYTVIGGFACEVLLRNAELDFRATKDIDMIVLLEDRFSEFGHIFWEFIREGGYKCGWRQDPDLHFYRFTDPKPGYPAQIELFSRMPDYHFHAEGEIIPIYIDAEVSSLSAIVMNEDFYNLLNEGKTVVDGISTIEAVFLIPFKMYAWVNLVEKKEKGEHVNERDLKKHKLDVFRLLQIVPDNATVQLSGLCKEAALTYIDRVQKETIHLGQIGLDFSQAEALARLREIYLAGENGVNT